MRHSELSAQAIAELAALDRIIDREPVGEEHLELAALVDSVRAQAPRMTADFSNRLDQRLLSRSRRARTPKLRRAPAARLAFAGGSIAAVAVAVVVVFGGGSNAPAPVAPSHSASPQRNQVTATAVGGLAANGAGGSVPLTASTAPTAAAPSVNAVVPQASTPRLVARDAAITLSSAPAQMQSVADEVVSATQHLGGVVENSNVDIHGAASSASFSLSVPASRLPALISTLSSLAGVRRSTRTASTSPTATTMPPPGSPTSAPSAPR